MTTTLPYTALLTLDELFHAAMDGREMQLKRSQIRQEARRLLQDVTERVEAYLQRRLIVRAHTLRFGAWAADERLAAASASSVWAHYAREWPVVEVVSVDGSTSLAPALTVYDGRLLGFDADTAVLTAHPRYASVLAGYRRSDQTLSALQEEVSGLTELPGLIPEEIREVAADIAIARIAYRQSGLAGLKEIGIQVGSNPITVQAAVRGYEDECLRRIHHHRYLA